MLDSAMDIIPPVLLKCLDHQALITLVRTFAPSISKEGICNGFTAMWLQAVATGPKAEAHFHQRLDYLAAYLSEKSAEDLKIEIETMLDENASGLKPDFSEEERAKIDIRAFCEAVALQQHPILISDAVVPQNHINAFLHTASKTLEDKKIQLFPQKIGVLIPTQKELSDYFEQITLILNQLETKDRVGFLFVSYNHTTGAYFNKDTQAWHYLNINSLEDQATYEQVVVSPERLAELIFISFFNQGAYSAFSLILVSPNFPELTAALQSTTNKFLSFEDRRDDSGSTALSLACRQGHYEAVQLLLNSPAKKNINLPNIIGQTPLWLACCNNHIEIVKLLLENGAINSIGVAVPSQGYTPLTAACANNYHKIVHLLLQEDAIHNMSRMGENEQMSTLILIACRKGNAKMLRYLLKNEAINSINVPDTNGETPLYIACAQGNLDVARLLVKNNAIIHQDDVNIALANEHREITSLLNKKLTGLKEKSHSMLFSQKHKKRKSQKNIQEIGYKSPKLQPQVILAR